MNLQNPSPEPETGSSVAAGGDLCHTPDSEGRPAESSGRRKNCSVPAKPGDWSVRREGFDAGGAAKIATESLRNVYRGLSEEGALSSEEDRWTQVAGAEIAAVGGGRKPLFHEETGEAARAMAEQLAPHFPGLHVEAWEGHLIVTDPGQLERFGATIEDVWTAVQSDQVGELLGYGVAHWRQGTARVEFFDGDDVPLAGFWTLAEQAEEFASERARDYEAVFLNVVFEITYKKKTPV